VLVTKYLRISIHSKLQFLHEVSPKLALSKRDQRAVAQLFSLRNTILHAAPEYAEARTAEPIFRWMEKHDISQLSVNEAALPRIPVLNISASRSDLLREAQSGVDIARKLVTMLNEIEFATVDA